MKHVLRKCLETAFVLACVGMIAFGAWSMGGCAGGFRLPWSKPPAINPPKGDAPPDDAFVTFLVWLACASIAAGVAALIASFIPVIGKLIPRTAAVVAIACGFGSWFASSFIDRFGEVLLWGALALSVIGCIVALWPYFAGIKNWMNERLGRRIAAGDPAVGKLPDPRAGVALIAAARGITKDTEKHKDKRKALLAAVVPTT